MATETKSGWSRFFSLKTSDAIDIEEREARQAARVIATPHGLRSHIDERQKAVDAMRAATESFLTDIENYFGDAAKYLTPAYTGRSRFENIENGHNRRLGMKWVDMVYAAKGALNTEIIFVYTETNTGVRVDFMYSRITGAKKVINDDYDPSVDNIYKDQHDEVDTFRSVRRYASHEDFVNSGDTPPQWFVDQLSHRKPVAK